MATTGEIIWASLIARPKDTQIPQTQERSAYLSFHFGKYLTYRTNGVPIRDFVLSDYAWESPNRVAPGVYLHLGYKELGTFRREELRFKLIWPYTWQWVSKTLVLCKFPYRPNVVLAELVDSGRGKYAGLRKVFLNNLQNVPYSVPTVLTPRRLFNLSLIDGVLSPKGIIPKVRVKRIRGPYVRKTLVVRPNPEVRSADFTQASESSGVAYSSIQLGHEVSRREWTGTTTPGFGSKKRSQLPENPHSVWLRETDWFMGYDLRKKSIAPFTYSNAWNVDLYPMTSPLLLASDSRWATMDNRALAKLNARANTGIQANMAQNLAQYTLTTNMIAKNATNIAASVMLLRKGKFSAAADKLFQNARTPGVGIRKGNPSKSKSLANNWLELQYGWKPLLSDIDESMRILANYMEGSTSVQEVSATASQAWELRTPKTGPIATPPYVGVEVDTTRLKTRYSLKYRVSSHTTNMLSQLGFTNPLSLVWEILPWSFVVDWFLPIGPYLETLSGPHGMEFVSGYKTRFGRQITSTNVGFNGKMPGDATATLNTRMDRFRRVIALNRTMLSAWPTGHFPQFKNPFSIEHAANAIALVRQAFRGR